MWQTLGLPNALPASEALPFHLSFRTHGCFARWNFVVWLRDCFAFTGRAQLTLALSSWGFLQGQLLFLAIGYFGRTFGRITSGQLPPSLSVLSSSAHGSLDLDCSCLGSSLALTRYLPIHWNTLHPPFVF